MKKMIILMVAMLGVTLTTNAQVFVKGKFLNDKATLKIYEMQADSSFCEVANDRWDYTKAKRKYELELEQNVTYIVKFTNKDMVSKTMQFIAYQSGDIELDVEFKTKKNAYITIKNNRAYVKRTTDQLIAAN